MQAGKQGNKKKKKKDDDDDDDSDADSLDRRSRCAADNLGLSSHVIGCDMTHHTCLGTAVVVNLWSATCCSLQMNASEL